MVDAIATVILAGMMFIPILNLFVGIIVGGGWFGFSGACAGAALAALIAIAEMQIHDWHGAQSARPKLSAQIIQFTGGHSHQSPWPPAPAFELLLRVEDTEDTAIAAALRNLAAKNRVTGTVMFSA